ncbi:MAG: DUF3566 domain-containing protein [Actinomycetota bacterium]|nr:DUF3566 domain-containing protein [Actinomycetota bacterium]
MSEGRLVRRVIRSVNPWSVLRFSALFYLSMLVVWVVAGMLLWLVASVTGVVGNVERFVADLFAIESFQFSGGLILGFSLVAGLVLVLLGAIVNVVMAVVYNLTSDVVGGVEVTVLESEQPARRTVV